MTKHYLVLLVSILASAFASAQSIAMIGGKIDHFKDDSIRCVIMEDILTRKMRTVSAPVVNERYLLKIPLNSVINMAVLTVGEQEVYGILEKGDKIEINFDVDNFDHSLSISGIGGDKFEFIDMMKHDSLNPHLNKRLAAAKDQAKPFDYMLEFLDSCEQRYLHMLDGLRDLYSTPAYEFLKAEVKGKFAFNRYYSVVSIHNESPEVTLATRTKEFTAASRPFLENPLHFEGQYAVSPTYSSNVSTTIEWASTRKEFENTAEKYKWIRTLLPDKLRPSVATLLLSRELRQINSRDSLEQLMGLLFQKEDEKYSQYLIERFEILKGLRSGMPAPGFVLTDQSGKKVTLAGLSGKVLYLDFWFAGCIPCLDLFEKLKPVKKKYSTDTSVVFLSVSVDEEKFWKRSLQKFGIEGSHAFTQNKLRNHPIIRDYGVNGYPSVFIISPKGIIVQRDPPRTAEATIQLIEEARKE